ncbi:hypothetical protein [Pseudomonas guariconensis]|uniref:ATP-binding protein n=1 Tax=Pseudomonas guariconensis TaxID=1288410 RepID=A0AAX0VPR4_9PSED|nr:hypothetical protein [Pseudomonas guariconensis]PLV14384.1 hypothetical protein CXG49_23090 [Pseudomonas guariconensis]PLV21675.1 hypothetical protein CXG53_23550 [Pseudomonas guariconensis]PLV26795.1 hypothetical protein CXG51_23545 [Pseudomonas guariconensis]
MKYYCLPLQPMQESGAFLLRALQNEETPLLDLLVRESIQNALDAGRNGFRVRPVSVDFSIREHSLDAIASTFSDGLNLQMLGKRYPRTPKLLEIRDSGTEGLTGPMTFDSVEANGQHGNFLKLVFEIGRTRSDDAAGGSWGLGKTCYFRMGAGLVIYYSRIKSAEGYEERLVASLVEDENREDRLQLTTQTGIAWWGAEEGLQAITAPDRINNILKALGAQPFTGKETGTAILIPLLKENLLPVFDEENGRAPWWYSRYEDYINVAIQRWFSARLDNPFFASGRYLRASVNGKEIAGSNMLPIFRVVQCLYDRAVGEAPEANDYLTTRGAKNNDVFIRAISLRGEFVGSGQAGRLLAVALTPRQLQMDAPDNSPSPETCVFSKTDSGAPHRPIMTFMRSPGMNICWDDSLDSRGWSGGFSGFADGRYVVGLFLPDSKQELMPSAARGLRSTIQNLEGYLRSCERADHAAWVDVNGGRIVEKIRAQCGRAWKEFGVPPQPSVTVKPSMRMSRKLAELVLPNRGFGGDSRFGKATPQVAIGGSSRGAKASSPELEIIEIRHTASAIAMKWCLRWGKVQANTPREITVSVDSEAGPITCEKWLESGLSSFPFRLESPRITNATSAVKCSQNADGAGVELTIVDAASLLPGLVLEGEVLVRMSDLGGKLLRPVVGVRILGSKGAAE